MEKYRNGQLVEMTQSDISSMTPSIGQLRLSLAEKIRKLRDQKTQGGGFFASGKWFHSDTFSRTQQIGLVMMGASIPSNLMWKTMDGSFIEMTSSLAAEVFASAAAQDAALFSYAESLIGQVETAVDPQAVDITAGWPAVYPGA